MSNPRLSVSMGVKFRAKGEPQVGGRFHQSEATVSLIGLGGMSSSRTMEMRRSPECNGVIGEFGYLST